MKLFTKLHFLIFKKKIHSVFISDAEHCPCTHFYILARSIKGVIPILLNNTNGSNPLTCQKRDNPMKDFIIFVHGNRDASNCFYKKMQDDKTKNVEIANVWWTNFRPAKGNLYFHVCRGSKIITKNIDLYNTFLSWVSYSRPVANVISPANEIKMVNMKFLTKVSENMAKRKSPEALKAAIVSVYKELEGDIRDRGEKSIGYTAFIATIANNVNSIKCSADEQF